MVTVLYMYAYSSIVAIFMLPKINTSIIGRQIHFPVLSKTHTELRPKEAAVARETLLEYNLQLYSYLCMDSYTSERCCIIIPTCSLQMPWLKKGRSVFIILWSGPIMFSGQNAVIHWLHDTPRTVTTLPVCLWSGNITTFCLISAIQWTKQNSDAWWCI